METGLSEAHALLRQETGDEPFEIAVVLGSGLGSLADKVGQGISLPYRDLPCFPPATVAGHRGRLVAGTLEGRRVLLLQGRHHLYEGYDARQVTIGVRLARRAGCRRLLLSNACGGINPGYRPGDFMFIADHINMLGDNPLRGIGGSSFVDLSELYRQDLFAPLLQFSQTHGIRLHRGVLAAMPGPSYETPSEIRMLRTLGADVASMSTVPEAIMGKYLGMEVAGLSFIANPAAGTGKQPLVHDEVLQMGQQNEDRFSALARHLITLWRDQEIGAVPRI